MECWAVDVRCGLCGADALALRCLECVEHFGQVWTEGVAGNVSSFVFGNLAQIGQLRGGLSEERQTRGAGEARIAWTSVAFNYVSDGGLPGIGHEDLFANARETLMRSGSTALTFVLTLGAAILPWGILLALIVAFWRSRLVTAVRLQLRSSQKANDPAIPPTS